MRQTPGAGMATGRPNAVGRPTAAVLLRFGLFAATGATIAARPGAFGGSVVESFRLAEV